MHACTQVLNVFVPKFALAINSSEGLAGPTGPHKKSGQKPVKAMKHHLSRILEAVFFIDPLHSCFIHEFICFATVIIDSEDFISASAVICSSKNVMCSAFNTVPNEVLGGVPVSVPSICAHWLCVSVHFYWSIKNSNFLLVKYKQVHFSFSLSTLSTERHFNIRYKRRTLHYLRLIHAN